MGSIKRKHTFLLVLFAFLSSVNLFAQTGVDGVRAGLFVKYTDQAKKVLRAQDVLLGTNLTGHKYLQEQVEVTTNFQREFDKYLTEFTDILNVAADIYGIFIEVDNAIKNVKVVKDIVVRQPGNVLAVALSKSKNNIYTDLIENGLQIAADIEHLLPLKKEQEKNAKMTQYERFKVLGNVRANLQKLNKKLRTLGRLINYTRIMDSWYDLKGTGKVYQPRRMSEVTNDCLKGWMRRANKVKY